MVEGRGRFESDENLQERCYQLVNDLIRLRCETDPAKGNETESGKNERALLALNKIGEMTACLTDWAEYHLFGVYYNLEKSESSFMDKEACDKHEHEAIWYGKDMPEDAFVGDKQLTVMRAAIADILHNTFGRYGLMGWRLIMKEALYALNEGQVEWLVTPVNTKQQGDAYDLQNLRWAAVKHVYKLMGEGWKKTAAQQKIAEYCGTNFVAIKSWEKNNIKARGDGKEILRDIQSASLVISKGFNEKKFQDMADVQYTALEMYRSCDALNPEDEAMIWLSTNMLNCVNLHEEYPLGDFEQRLIDAGLRKPS